MPRIEVISYDKSTDRLREIYDNLIQKRGKLADVHMIQSLRPESIVHHMDLYLGIMFSKSELSRADREMIAVVVSAENKCEYCQIHHGEALNQYWKDLEKVQKLRSDFNSVSLTDFQTALCRYAAELTFDPALANDIDLTANLKSFGISDSALLDATLVIAYFNFVNRMVLGLDVRPEADAGKGFEY